MVVCMLTNFSFPLLFSSLLLSPSLISPSSPLSPSPLLLSPSPLFPSPPLSSPLPSPLPPTVYTADTCRPTRSRPRRTMTRARRSAESHWPPRTSEEEEEQDEERRLLNACLSEPDLTACAFLPSPPLFIYLFI